MKKQSFYSSPAVEVVEVAIEQGIAQSSGGPTPGAPGDTVYNPGEDDIDF